MDGVPKGRRITIRQLLDMTSGIRDFSPRFFERRVFVHPHRTWRPGELVRRAVRWKRYFARPGRHWRYSNPSYILLGQIGRITGKRIGALLERRILDPLGMDQTRFRPRTTSKPERFAHGYIRLNGEVVDMTDWNLSYAWTAGAASSTLADLGAWVPPSPPGSECSPRACSASVFAPWLTARRSGTPLGWHQRRMPSSSSRPRPGSSAASCGLP